MKQSEWVVDPTLISYKCYRRFHDTHDCPSSAISDLSPSDFLKRLNTFLRIVVNRDYNIYCLPDLVYRFYYPVPEKEYPLSGFGCTASKAATMVMRTRVKYEIYNEIIDQVPEIICNINELSVSRSVVDDGYEEQFYLPIAKKKSDIDLLGKTGDLVISEDNLCSGGKNSISYNFDGSVEQLELTTIDKLREKSILYVQSQLKQMRCIENYEDVQVNDNDHDGKSGGRIKSFKHVPREHKPIINALRQTRVLTKIMYREFGSGESYDEPKLNGFEYNPSKASEVVCIICGTRGGARVVSSRRLELFFAEVEAAQQFIKYVEMMDGLVGLKDIERIIEE